MAERWYSTITLNVTITGAANAPAALKLAKEAARQAKAAVASQDGTSVKKPVVTFSTEPPVSAIHA